MMKTEDILVRERELRAMREALAAYIVAFEFDRIATYEVPSTMTGDASIGPRGDDPTESPRGA